MLYPQNVISVIGLPNIFLLASFAALFCIPHCQNGGTAHAPDPLLKNPTPRSRPLASIFGPMVFTQ